MSRISKIWSTRRDFCQASKKFVHVWTKSSLFCLLHYFVCCAPGSPAPALNQSGKESRGGAVWKKRWGPASILPPRQSPGPPAPRAEPASGRIRRLLRAGTVVLARTLARPADGPPPRRRQDRGGRTPPDHSAQSCDPTQRPPRHPPSSSEPARCPAAPRDLCRPSL